MARPKTDSPSASSTTTQPVVEATPSTTDSPAVVDQNGGAAMAEPTAASPEQIDEVFKHLKTLLGTVEKLQKARQEVGDIKPQLLRLLDGELIDGEDLDQLKSGVSGLAKLVKLYSDYQTALEQAQPARDLLDSVLK
jgi:tRNA C32,U32 (ribose-2'-O)-methylase TrmJ